MNSFVVGVFCYCSIYIGYLFNNISRILIIIMDRKYRICFCSFRSNDCHLIYLSVITRCVVLAISTCHSHLSSGGHTHYKTLCMVIVDSNNK